MKTEPTEVQGELNCRDGCDCDDEVKLDLDVDDDEETSSTCPICLSENHVSSARKSLYEGDGENASIAHEFHHNQHDVPMFQLSCGHSYCLPCLLGYIRSKLMEGKLQIPCCHFDLGMSEGLHICDTDIAGSELLQLVHLEPFVHTYVPGNGFCTSGGCNDIKSSLEEKYHKLQFDQLHGKDSVRRCPTCDEPQLFDAEKMKLYDTNARVPIQSNSSTISNEPSSSDRSHIDTRKILERFTDRIRGRRNTRDINDPSNHEIETANMTGEETKQEELDIEEATDVEPNYSTNSSMLSVPMATCQKCSTEFCYFHSNAHPSMSCEQYIKQTSELDRVNVEFAHESLHSKQCPVCGILVSKEGGCNQIKCGNCGSHFCWLCLAKIDDGAFPQHFRWWNLNGCPNMQLDTSEEPLKCTRRMATALSVLQIIVLGIPSLILAIASSLVCPCLVMNAGITWRERFVNCVSFWGSFLSSMIMFPFSCVGMLLLALMYSFVGTLIFMIKGCIALKKRFYRQTPPDEGSDTVFSADTENPGNNISGGFTLADLERMLGDIEDVMEQNV